MIHICAQISIEINTAINKYKIAIVHVNEIIQMFSKCILTL